MFVASFWEQAGAYKRDEAYSNSNIQHYDCSALLSLTRSYSNCGPLLDYGAVFERERQCSIEMIAAGALSFLFLLLSLLSFLSFSFLPLFFSSSPLLLFSSSPSPFYPPPCSFPPRFSSPGHSFSFLTTSFSL